MNRPSGPLGHRRRGGSGVRARLITLGVIGLIAVAGAHWLTFAPGAAAGRMADVGILEHDRNQVCADRTARNSCTIEGVIKTYGLDPHSDELFIAAIRRSLPDQRSFDPDVGFPVPVDQVPSRP